MLNRIIPKTEEPVPVIGLGTWQTFDVGNSDRERGPLIEVLRRFAAAGGKLIDSSPMYGKAEGVAGDLKENVPGVFLATKVWTRGRDQGVDQMRRSMDLLRSRKLDLMQVHNLLDWQTQLATMREWKRAGRIRYIGVTHYQTAAFPQLAGIMENEDIDFVQLPYSIALPDAEKKLLPLAQKKRIAVLVNRPFEAGDLFRNTKSKALPPWAGDFNCASWAEIFLRWIIAHEAVTCVIPATGNPLHVAENLRAGEGLLTMKQRDELRRRLNLQV